MQHNNWAKDRDLLAEAYDGAIDGGRSADEDIPPQYREEDIVGEEDEGNVLERLEEFMNSHPETVEGLRQIIIDFEDIIDDINSLEAPDQMIDAFDLGIHLARLAPDTTKGSALY